MDERFESWEEPVSRNEMDTVEQYQKETHVREKFNKEYSNLFDLILTSGQFEENGIIFEADSVIDLIILTRDVAISTRDINDLATQDCIMNIPNGTEGLRIIVIRLIERELEELAKIS